MAFNSVLRRASKSFLPLAVRAVGSPRTFHRTIPTVLSVENRTTLQNFLPFSHFSTAITAQKPTAEDNLVRVLETETDCTEKPQYGENIPNEFPFKLEDNLGERTISLNRKLQEETIKMVAGMPNVSIDADDNAKDSHVSSIPLVASATKDVQWTRALVVVLARTPQLLKKRGELRSILYYLTTERMNMSSPELPPGFRFQVSSSRLGAYHPLSEEESPIFISGSCYYSRRGYLQVQSMGTSSWMIGFYAEFAREVTRNKMGRVFAAALAASLHLLASGAYEVKKSNTCKDYYYDLHPCLMAPPESKEADERFEFQEVSPGCPISGVDSNSQPTMVSTVKERLEYIKKILSIGAFEELAPATPKKRLHVSSSNKAENESVYEVSSSS